MNVILKPVQIQVTLRNSPAIAARTVVSSLVAAATFELIAEVSGDSYQKPGGGTSNEWYQVKKDGETLYVASAWVIKTELPPDPVPDEPRRVYFDLHITSAEDLATLEKVASLLEYIVGAIRAEVENEKIDPDYENGES